MSTTTRQAIENELNELYKPGQSDRGPKTIGYQRNYTINLVSYAPTPAVCQEVDAVLRELTPLYPGRYITLCLAPDEEPNPLYHRVSGRCFISPGRDKEETICCDIIDLVAKAEVLEHLYGLTLSLLIPDLAVELWWPGDVPLQSMFFRQIADEADRVWVDSAQFSHPEAGLATLADNWGLEFPKTVLADLNWVRFRRWRNLVAELFDGEWTPYLSQIKRVVIEYGEGSQTTRSFLLTCWMAAKLGWRYQGEPLTKFPAEIEFDSNGQPVTVAIRPVPAADQKRDRLFAVRIFTGETPQGLFTVIRDKDPQCVIARSEINGEEAFSRILCFEHLEFSHLLGEGLKHWGRDPAWKSTLAMLRTIITAPAAV